MMPNTETSDNGSVKKGSRVLRTVVLALGIALMAAGVLFIVYPIALRAYTDKVDSEKLSEFDKIAATPPAVLVPIEDEDELEVAEEPAAPAWEDEDSIISDEQEQVVPLPEEAPPVPDAKLTIPRIELTRGIYTTTSVRQMYKRMRYGIAAYPGMFSPGKKGNFAMAAHRTGSSDYFRYLNKLKPGDKILVQTTTDTFEYEVEKIEIIMPNDWSLVKPTDYAALTMTTCEAWGGDSNARRLVVRARLVAAGN